MNNLLAGTYITGTSFFHKSNAYIKIWAFIIILITIIKTDTYILYLLWFLILIICFRIAGKGITEILNSFVSILPFCLFIIFMNFFFYSNKDPYFTFLFLSPSYKGLIHGLNVIFKMLILIGFINLLLSTTSSFALTKAITLFLYPFKYLGLDIYEIALILSISLTFIPTLYKDMEQIKKAQLARGAKLNSKNLITRALSVLPFIIPLFMQAFKRADDLSIALVSKGKELKTKHDISFGLSLNSNDYCLIIFCILLISVLIIRGK